MATTAPKAGAFPSPYEIDTPPGCEGWEEMYPYYALFDERRRDTIEVCVDPRCHVPHGRRIGRLAQNAPHRVTRQVEQAADLAHAVALRQQYMHGGTDLGWCHG